MGTGSDLSTEKGGNNLWKLWSMLCAMGRMHPANAIRSECRAAPILSVLNPKTPFSIAISSLNTRFFGLRRLSAIRTEIHWLTLKP